MSNGKNASGRGQRRPDLPKLDVVVKLADGRTVSLDDLGPDHPIHNGFRQNAAGALAPLLTSFLDSLGLGVDDFDEESWAEVVRVWLDHVFPAQMGCAVGEEDKKEVERVLRRVLEKKRSSQG